MNKKLLLLMLFALIISRSWAQQTYPVTDSMPVMVNGLQIGYHIKSQEVKAVGNKGNFSRYAISFYVTNTANVPIIIPYQEGWNRPGSTFSLLARFNILNATGARLTSNVAMINAQPYKTFTFVNEKDPQSNRFIQVKRLTQVGFWVQAGQTINADEIVIVPLNQLPNVKVTYFGNPVAPVAPPQYAVNPGFAPNNAPPPVNMQGFLKFRNLFNNTYINVQTGPAVSSAIDNGWWSAQWQLTPVAGTNYYNIRNRWKGNFIDTNNGYVIISVNPQSTGSMWAMEATHEANVFRIKNAQTGGYLSLANNNLVLVNDNGPSSTWLLEQPF
jgi:hypothetical protein